MDPLPVIIGISCILAVVLGLCGRPPVLCRLDFNNNNIISYTHIVPYWEL